MPTYLFCLGHVPDLSVAEISAVLATRKIDHEASRPTALLYEIKTKSELQISDIMNQLGGTTKILELVGSATPLPRTITSYLSNLPEQGKLNFSLSGQGAQRLSLTIKKELSAIGRSARYVQPKNTATILHNGLVESASDLTILNDKLFVTRAIQPLEEFSARDYGRPGADPKSGMLPPKLARIMLNLSGTSQTDALLDPFCGSGTVLMEALSLGYTNLIGSDHSSRAIEDTQKNIDWFCERVSLRKEKLSIKLLQADVRDLAKRLPARSVDTVVTEPYMGKPLRGDESRSFVLSQAEELTALYRDTFRELAKVTKANCKIIFITPELNYQKEVIRIDLLPIIKKAGFFVCQLTTNFESLLYSRSGQKITRRIWKLQKK